MENRNWVSSTEETETQILKSLQEWSWKRRPLHDLLMKPPDFISPSRDVPEVWEIRKVNDIGSDLLRSLEGLTGL
ncbi:hypothetical protein L2E82_28642 [Cichorium intybus]|uniref:Uncharacterized protein n=1 Tax=Cichorium intybus TaxID=13427 RepID=A0ACB9CWM1_CICIN|nr:hypothetical protein L2E82_28642 [Cichorium intybus]